MQEQISKKIALVVEDEPAISRSCQRILIAEGFDVDVADNGFIAMNMVDKNHYDLCLSDIRTPQMNCIQLFHYLEKAHPDLANNTIFTTGDPQRTDTAKFLEEVKKPFIQKPFSSGDLKKLIRDFMNVEKPEAVDTGSVK
jgi:DNA-binding NtrC family response regulator